MPAERFVAGNRHRNVQDQRDDADRQSPQMVKNQPDAVEAAHRKLCRRREIVGTERDQNARRDIDQNIDA